MWRLEHCGVTMGHRNLGCSRHAMQQGFASRWGGMAGRGGMGKGGLDEALLISMLHSLHAHAARRWHSVLGLARSASALVTQLVTMRICLCYRATLYALSCTGSMRGCWDSQKCFERSLFLHVPSPANCRTFWATSRLELTLHADHITDSSNDLFVHAQVPPFPASPPLLASVPTHILCNPSPRSWNTACALTFT